MPDRKAGLVTVGRASVLFVALALAGCSESSPRELNARVDTLASGRVVVANTGEPAWTGETAWRLEEDLRLGTAEEDGPAEQQFGQVFDIVTDSRGRIYVLDVVASTIRVFDPDGVFVHDVGSSGEGPGELSGPIELSMAAGDTLWVADQLTARYSLFAPDGTFARQLHQRNGLSALGGHAVSGSRYVQWGFTFPNGGIGRVHVLPIRLGPTELKADTFPPIAYTQRLMENDRPAVFFSPGPTGTVDREGRIWFAHAAAYEIHRRALEGDTILTFRLPAEPHALTAADRAWVDRRLSDPPSRFREDYLAALPEVRPLVGAIVPDGAGHVYVLVDVAGRPGGTALDVFEETGIYMGRLDLPTPVLTWPSPVLHVTRDHVYAVVTDELDVPYVSRLRIVRE